jgi:hypothetical protein
VIVFHASSAGGAAPAIDVVLPVNFAYCLVYPEDAAERRKIASFRHWILAEIDVCRSQMTQAVGRAATRPEPVKNINTGCRAKKTG